MFFEAHDITSELDMVDLAAIVNPASPALNGQGNWKAARLRFGAVETTNVNAKFRLESREVFFTDLNADAYGGKATGDFSVSLAKKNASFKADARMSGINMTRLLAAFHEVRGRLTGNLEGDLKLAGEIEHTTSPLARNAWNGAREGDQRPGAEPDAQLKPNEAGALQRSGPCQRESLFVLVDFHGPRACESADFEQGRLISTATEWMWMARVA